MRQVQIVRGAGGVERVYQDGVCLGFVTGTKRGYRAYRPNGLPVDGSFERYGTKREAIYMALAPEGDACPLVYPQEGT